MTLSMVYAWGISQTAYVTTSVQFISPLLVMMTVHWTWMVATRSLEQGYAQTVFFRSLVSGLALALLVPLIEIASPMPSHAGSGSSDGLQSLLMVLFCLVVLAAVLAIAAGALHLLLKLFAFVAKAIWRRSAKSNRMHDLSSLVAGVVLVMAASLEGIPSSYRFDGAGQATASVHINAPPDDVWAAMQTATAAEFPLPDLLQMFPQPVAVPLDEGTEIGSERIVVVEGREGRGSLHLRVVERRGMKSVFHTLSDTTPISRWAQIKSITYEVLPASEGSTLRVTLDYERLLAPSWVFTPMMKVAARLGMGVLATDTKQRAEALSRNIVRPAL